MPSFNDLYGKTIANTDTGGVSFNDFFGQSNDLIKQRLAAQARQNRISAAQQTAAADSAQVSKNQYNNQSVVSNIKKYGASSFVDALKKVGKEGLNVGENIVQAPIGLAKDFNRAIIQPAAQQAEQLPHLIAHPSEANKIAQQVQQNKDITAEAYKSGKLTVNPTFLDENSRQQVAQMVKSGKSSADITKYISDVKKQQDITVKRLAAETVGTGALVVGGGNVSEAFSQGGIRAAAVPIAESGVSGGVSNVASTLQQNPNASNRQLLTSGAQGAALGTVAGLAGAGLGALRGKTATQKAQSYFNDKPKATSDYQQYTMKEFGTNKPNVVSPDSAKFLVNGGVISPSESAAFHEPASNFAKDYYKRLLADQTTKDQPVLITAGGAGAGKTSGLKLLTQEGQSLDNFAAINDTNLTSLKSATDRIEPALASGRPVVIQYIYRDPLEAFTNGNIPRGKKTGRIVPLATHADTHVGSLDTIKQVVEKYKNNPNVSIQVIDNSRGAGNAQVVSLDFLKNKGYNKDELIGKLHDELNKAQINNQISPETYAAYGGKLPAQITQPGQNYRSQLESQRPNGQINLSTQAARDVKGGVTLNSGVNPGLDVFISQDVSPKIRNTVQGISALRQEAKSVVTPASIDNNSKETAQIVRNYKAVTANQAATEAARGKQAFKAFNRTSEGENIANISHFENTGTFAREPVKGYSQAYKASTDYAYKLNQDTYGNSKLGYITNYVRRNFTFKNEQDAQSAISVLASSPRTLRPASGNVLKSRTLDMPLDQALANLQARGIKAKLITTNPELLRQATVNSAIQANGFKAMGDELKSSGLIKFVKAGGQAPEGMVRLDDHAFQTYFPSKVGLVKAGEYYASESTAKILNNAISPGLEKYAAYRTIRNIKNNLNLVQLGLSAFHAGTTTINSSLNDLALGIGDVLKGKVVRGSKEAIRGAIPGASVIRQTYLGSKAFKDFASQSPEAAKVLKESINPSGFRLRIDNKYKTTVSENMIKAFANGNPIGGLLRLPSALIEQSTRPIMEHLVPNAKLGAMMDRIASIQARNPGASSKELAGLFSKASDSVDNIYGQLVYDNLFWNKTVKDLALVSQRSVGWNLGTIRELGGGVKDIGQIFKGKGVSDRTLYTATLPMLVGTYGAVYQYLHTGHGPTELKDYFFPKTGQTDKNGNPERISFPSYMKDVFAYRHDPLATLGNKLAPEFSTAKDLFTNKNYYGDLIRNPDDSVGKQLQQVGSYLLNNITPFSVSQTQKRAKEGASGLQHAESFVGLTNAPGYITKSGIENKVSTALDKYPHAPRTPEQVAQDNAKVKTGSGLERSFDYLTNLDRPTAAQILSVSSPTEIAKLSPDYRKQLIQRLTQSAYHPSKNTKQSTIDASKKLIATLKKYQ